jgi:creatinine amidohydrolase/Fe(II)-dependent formamide hydrolase-like protein
MTKPFGGGDGQSDDREQPAASTVIHPGHPWRLKEMTPAEVRDLVVGRPWLIVPVGTTEQHGPHLPLGTDSIIVERLADDLSARFAIPRAPTIEYGVNTSTRWTFTGGATLKRKTLHRVMNELVESWETWAQVREFVVLTAQGGEAHQEALSTIRVLQSKVHVVDIFALDFSQLIERPGGPIHGGEVDTSLLLYIAPHLVRMSDAQDYALTPKQMNRYRRGESRPIPTIVGSLGFPSMASAQKGEQLYRFILDRIAERCFCFVPEAEGRA